MAQASILRDIYKAIEETSIDLGGKTVRCRGLDGLKSQVPRAALPLRLLLPVGSNANGRNLSIISADHSGRSAVWVIPELALIAPMAQGQGLEEYAGDLVDYVVALEQAINDRRVEFNGFLINQIATDTGMFEWPAESNSWYFGVRTNYTVTELI